MKIAVVSNMYPDEKHPSYGVFVKNFCGILDDIGVEHKDHVMLKSDSMIRKIANYIIFYIGTTIALLFERYDLIYVHYASHSSIPVLIAHIFRKKTIYTNVHGSDVVPENVGQEKMQKYTRKVLSISKKIIVPSEYFKDLVSNKYCISKNMIFVSPSGGIDSKVFYKEKEKKPGDVIKLGYVGRISRDKGWDSLLMACSELSISYELIVVGNGPEYGDMRALAKELGVDKYIHWLNMQPQEKLRGIYNEMDVLIFPTKREGESLGLVGLEAMACGTPVIASDYAAPKYYVIDGENGYKFEMGNFHILAQVIERYKSLDAEDKYTLEINAIESADNFSQKQTQLSLRRILMEGR